MLNTFEKLANTILETDACDARIMEKAVYRDGGRLLTLIADSGTEYLTADLDISPTGETSLELILFTQTESDPDSFDCSTLDLLNDLSEDDRQLAINLKTLMTECIRFF